MHLEELWHRMEVSYEAFPPKVREAARFVREHPTEVALNGLRAVARRSATSPGSLIRLVQALGCSGWDQFQAIHRDWLTADGHAVFSRRADRMIGEGGLLDRLSAAEAVNLASAFAPELLPRLEAAAGLLHAAPAIGVLGLRSCHPAAYCLHYGMSLFRGDVRLVGGTGGPALDEIDALVPGAALVAISIAPYSRETVAAARLAREAGFRVVGISDDQFSPIARLADVALAVCNESPAHLASITGVVALAQALTGLVLARSGDAGLAELRRREARLAARSAYLPPEV
jgi:DNA-binding MurR/RpiR family transcriptional regulator